MAHTKQMSVAKPARSRGRPRPEDVTTIERELLKVALDEFLQHGYGGASMNRIVKVAGISKTTLYSRFSSKKQLFSAIIHEQIEEISPAKSLQSSPGSSSLKDGLISYANYMLERSLRPDMLGVNRLIYSESHRFPELGAAAVEKNQLGVRRISGFIRERAALDGVPCTDPDGVAEVFISMLRGWYLDIVLTGRPISATQRERWVRRAVRVLFSSREQW